MSKNKQEAKMKSFRLVLVVIFLILLFIIALLYMAYSNLKSQNDNLMRNFAYLDKRINGLETEVRSGGSSGILKAKSLPVENTMEKAKVEQVEASVAKPRLSKPERKTKTIDNAPGNKGFLIKAGKATDSAN